MTKTKIRPEDIIKDYRKYSGYISGYCQYSQSYYNNCKTQACAASKKASKRFCMEHWFKCVFCDQNFPTYKNGRIKPRCNCKQAVEFCKSVKENKDTRSMARELITLGMSKMDFECQWHASGRGKYTLKIKKNGFSLGEATLTITEEEIKLGDRSQWYYSNDSISLKFTDPDYTIKACEYLIGRLLKSINGQVDLAGRTLNNQLTKLEKIRAGIQAVLPELEDQDQSLIVERWNLLRTDVGDLSTYLKNSAPEMKESIKELLNKDLESH